MRRPTRATIASHVANRHRTTDRSPGRRLRPRQRALVARERSRDRRRGLAVEAERRRPLDRGRDLARRQREVSLLEPRVWRWLDDVGASAYCACASTDNGGRTAMDPRRAPALY